MSARSAHCEARSAEGGRTGPLRLLTFAAAVLLAAPAPSTDSAAGKPGRTWVLTVRQDAPHAPLQAPRGQGGVVIGSSGARASAAPEKPGARTFGVRGSEQSFEVRDGGSVSVAMQAAVPFTFYTWAGRERATTRGAGTGSATANGGAARSTTFTTTAGVGTAQSVHYDALLGFDVQPTVQGQDVTLSIRPQLSTVVPDAQAAAVNPVVRGRLGEWIAIGGADARDTDLQPHQRGVWVRVEPVR